MRSIISATLGMGESGLSAILMELDGPNWLRV